MVKVQPTATAEKEKGNVLEEVEVLDRKISMNQGNFQLVIQRVNLLNRQIMTYPEN